MLAVCDGYMWLSVTDSDHMDYSSNNGNGGLNCEQSVAATGGSSKAEVQGYSYAERNTDDPGMSSSDMNPTYPEVVLNPGADNASSDSILGHLWIRLQPLLCLTDFICIHTKEGSPLVIWCLSDMEWNKNIAVEYCRGSKWEFVGHSIHYADRVPLLRSTNSVFL